jgi:hypothetical protein
MKDSPTAKNYFQQFQRESESYTATSVEFKLPDTLDKAVTMLEELKPQSDALFIEGMEGILDKDGNPLTDREVFPKLVTQFGKPTICANAYTVHLGVLAAVVKTGQEQGRTAAKMLLKAMQGTPVADIPITRNRLGRRIINVDVMKALGIKPTAKILRGAQMVKTEK